MLGSIVTVVVLALLSGVACTSPTPDITPDEAKAIAKEAFVYGFPMVMNYKTMYAYTLNEKSPEYKGPFNFLGCAARVYTPEDKAGKYLIASQSWSGEEPDGIGDVIRCETDIFFVVVRTQLMDENDLENVKRVQGEYQIQPLSAYLGNNVPEAASTDSFPVWNEGDQFTSASFNYLDVMLGLLEPVEQEIELMERFAKLGIGTSENFAIDNFDDEVQKAIEDGVEEGFQEIETFIKAYVSDPLISAKIFGTREFLENSAKENYQLEDLYVLRAVAAHRGLYGNSEAEAIYPTYLKDSEGAPLNTADNKYILTFQKDELPPVKAFWSLTMYDGKTQLFIHNPLNRYLLNSNMEDDFVYGKDGSLTLYVQKDSPGKELEANWLPAPDGPFYSVLRLYGPEDAALNGEWINPPMVKAK